MGRNPSSRDTERRIGLAGRSSHPRVNVRARRATTSGLGTSADTTQVTTADTTAGMNEAIVASSLITDERLHAFAFGLIIGGLLSGVLVALVILLRTRSERAVFEQALIRAEAERDHLIARHEDLEAAFDRASDQLDVHFRRLAHEALQLNQDAFLNLAHRTLDRSLAQGEQRVAAREHAIEGLVRPIRDLLARTEGELREIEHNRTQAFATLEERLARISEDHRRLAQETTALTRALSKPGVRGRWGELTLKRSVELAGMSAHCDFAEQAELTSENGHRLRPDLLIKLPGDRVIIVDAKTPLDAYLDAISQNEPAASAAALDRHAEQLRARILELAQKRYFAALTTTPEFTVLFIPGERILSAALERRPELFDLALERRIHLATPSTLIALLRAVEAGWQQAQLTEHAYQIRDFALELTERVGQLGDDLTGLGQYLSHSVKQYNRLTSRFDRDLVRGSKRLGELGIRSRKPHQTPEQVVDSPHPPSGDAFKGHAPHNSAPISSSAPGALKDD